MRKSIVTATIVAAMVASVLSIGAAARGADGAGAVTISAKYTGKGNVDGNHRLWIWLFDTPSIGPGSMPIAELSTDKNGGEVTTDIGGDVWIAVAYDEAGGFGGQAPPPSGSPVTIYSDAKGAPLAVKAGAADKVAITFDDKNRMP